MTFGVELYKSDGRALTFATGFTFVDAINVQANLGGVKAYPEYVGFKFYLCPVLSVSNIIGMSPPSVDYSAGYPIVSWLAGQTPMVIYVMGR